MFEKEKTRVGVLRGGLGPEYNISLETGSYVLAHIPKDRYRPVDIFIDHDGVWHANGISFNPEDLGEHVDVVFNCLHGIDGEDGRIQKFLEKLNIPFVGSDSLSSSLTGFKHVTKERLGALGYATPKYVVLKDLSLGSENKHDHIRRKAMEVFKKMPGPWIVKPILGSASTHTYLVTTFTELISVLDHLSGLFDEILVEEFVRGKEVAAAILEGYRNVDHYVMPIHEVVQTEASETPRPMGLHRAYIVGQNNPHKHRIEEMTRHIHHEFVNPAKPSGILSCINVSSTS
jgi:D-alanine-D-alanine ligase